MLTGKPPAWIARFPSAGAARVRLFAFPYAGGGAGAYRGWRGKLPPDVELALVQLPGREARIAEPPFRRMDDLVPVLADALLPHLDVPSVFFGHSMGAVIAFEVARHLERLGAHAPQRLIVSGHRAPTIACPRASLHALPDAVLLAELTRLGGTPEAVLAHPELLELLLPVMRADLELCETYAHALGPPLSAGIMVLGGREDPDVGPADLEAWRPLTRGPFEVHVFPGNHFFLHGAEREVLARLSQALSPRSS